MTTPSPRSPSRLDRRSFLGRSAAAGVVAWTAPAILSTPPVAAAAGSCAGLTVHEFATGLDGWTIDNGWGSGSTGLWRHDTNAARDGGSLHYGRGVGGTYSTGRRNSGRVRSPQFDIPATGTSSITFTVWREVEAWWNTNYDVLRLSTFGGGPSQVLWSAGSDGGTNGIFETHTVTIPTALNGQAVQFQFDFDTVDRYYNNFEGIYIGRFQITACPSLVPAAPAAAPAGFGLLQLKAASLSTLSASGSSEPPPITAPPRG